MKKEKLLIKHGRVVDPSQGLDAVSDILVEGGKIKRISRGIFDPSARVIEASGRIVMPGLVDMHVHLREPGREDKETVASGTAAALKGGVTTVLAMPNTAPAIDTPERLKRLQKIIKETSHARVCIAGAITKERQGTCVTDLAALKRLGAVAITDDGNSVESATVFLQALRKAAKLKLLVICHSEDKKLSSGGVVNFGYMSTKLGLRGIPKESEYARVRRDILLAEQAGASVHIAHVSCKESVESIATAKKKGLKITAETCPHYFALSEEALSDYDTNMKMNPPLRTKEDVEAIREGLKTGVIDVIASDHAPHTINEKDIEFDHAEFGVIGLETELSVAITELIEHQVLTWPELAVKMARNPAGILGIPGGNLLPGSVADIVVIDPHARWVVKKHHLISKSQNSPFIGKEVKGVVSCTLLAGKTVYQHSS